MEDLYFGGKKIEGVEFIEETLELEIDVSPISDKLWDAFNMPYHEGLIVYKRKEFFIDSMRRNPMNKDEMHLVLKEMKEI